MEARVAICLGNISDMTLIDTVQQLIAIEPCCADDLDSLAGAVVGSALRSDTSFIQTYADLVKRLLTSFPSFAPQSVARAFLAAVQSEFETCLETLTITSEDAVVQETPELSSIVAFVGHLYVRKLLPLKVLESVFFDLLGPQSSTPDPHLIKCSCLLVKITGEELDSKKQGWTSMSMFLQRLGQLAGSIRRDDNQAVYQQDIREDIKALYLARRLGWKMPSLSHSLIVLELVPKMNEGALTSCNEVSVQTMGGHTCAVVRCRTLEEWQQLDLHTEIFEQTAIHPNRFKLVIRNMDGLPDLLPEVERVQNSQPDNSCIDSLGVDTTS